MIYIWVYPFLYLALKANNVLGGSVVMVSQMFCFFKLAKNHESFDFSNTIERDWHLIFVCLLCVGFCLMIASFLEEQ